jgi:hypothetical protein
VYAQHDFRRLLILIKNRLVLSTCWFSLSKHFLDTFWMNVMRNRSYRIWLHMVHEFIICKICTPAPARAQAQAHTHTHTHKVRRLYLQQQKIRKSARNVVQALKAYVCHAEACKCRLRRHVMLCVMLSCFMLNLFFSLCDSTAHA